MDDFFLSIVMRLNFLDHSVVGLMTQRQRHVLSNTIYCNWAAGGQGLGPESQIWSVCLQVMHDNNNNNNNDVCNTNMCKATMLKKTCNSSYTHKKEGSHIPLKGLLVKIKSSEIGYITSQEGIFPKTRFIWLLFHGVTHGRSMTNSTDPRQHLRLWAVRNTVHPQEFEI